MPPLSSPSHHLPFPFLPVQISPSPNPVPLSAPSHLPWSVTMSQEGGGPDNMLWEAHAWAFSNSDNSGGCDDKPLEKTPPESGSNSPADVTAAVGTKRTRNGPKKAKNGGHGGQKDKGIAGAGGESDHEIHIWTERERRKKMRNMFANLHALLPHLPAKADKSTIVDEAVNYIRTLQLTLQKLQKQKLERLRGAILEEPLLPVTAQQTHVPAAETSSREAFMADRGKNWAAITPSLAISVPLFAQSFQTWTSPNVVLSMTGNDAHINICAMKKPGLLSSVLYVLERHKLEVVSAHVSSDYFRSMFMIHAHANGVPEQYPEMLPAEEIFKLAVGEILSWIQ